MTDHISFPPLLELTAREIETQKQHLLTEILQAGPHLSWPGDIAVLRPRFALPAVAVIGAAVAATVFVVTLGGPTSATQDQATGTGLKSPALGMLSGGMYPGARQIPVADASTTFGAAVILPNTSLVQPSDATEAETVGDCPYNPTDTTSSNCSVSVAFGAQLSVGYTRPLQPDTPGWYSDYTQHVPAAQVISLEGLPALEIPESGSGPQGPGSSPGWVLFALGQTQVDVAGYQDSATLEAAAQSIIDQASAGS
jgi:hypothetical protein